MMPTSKTRFYSHYDYVVHLTRSLSAFGHQKVKFKDWRKPTTWAECITCNPNNSNQLLLLGQSPDQFKRTLHETETSYHQGNLLTRWWWRLTGRAADLNKKLILWGYYHNHLFLNEAMQKLTSEDDYGSKV